LSLTEIKLLKNYLQAFNEDFIVLLKVDSEVSK